MNKLLTLLNVALLASFSFSQELETVVGSHIEVQPYTPNYISNNEYKASTCNGDTLLYLDTKMTASTAVVMNNSTSAYGFCQYFDCPSPVTIHGVQFIGYKADNTNGDSIEVFAYVHKASGDSIPFGGFLTEGDTMISNNNHGFNLNLLTKTIMFDSAVTLTEDYVVSVMNNSPTSVNMYCTDYNAGDGQGEHLGSARIGFNWVRGYDVNVGGVPFDADMLFYPIVSYELDAEIAHSPNCNPNASTDTLTNLSSAILFNRFYSQAALNGEDSLQCLWNYGDGSPVENHVNAIHDYPAGEYIIALTTTLMGWTANCGDTDAISTCHQPASTEEFEQITFQLFPNPAQDFVTLSSSHQLESVELFDISGKLLYTEKMSPAYQHQLQLSNLPNGMYVVKAKTDSGQQLFRRLNIYK
ncbi:MAG: T9SS type A sorting domain-containing protein [Crocinitomicaceae bacterium]